MNRVKKMKFKRFYNYQLHLDDFVRKSTFLTSYKKCPKNLIIRRRKKLKYQDKSVFQGSRMNLATSLGGELRI
jgi:hypothetical protein